MTRTPLSASADIRVAVSTVIFTLRHPRQADSARGPVATNAPASVVLPLVRRTRDPYDGCWALPGGWLDEAEGLETAASRTLAETTALSATYLEQLYAFGAPGRSPSRVISIVYWALLRSDQVDAQLANVEPAENVEWFDSANLPQLAFDHNQIVDYALWRLRNKVSYSRIAHGFLPEEFTLTGLREVYELILGKRLDPANFRRQAEASGSLLPTESFRTGSHRPARLYRYNQDVEFADRGPLAAAHSPLAPRSRPSADLPAD